MDLDGNLELAVSRRSYVGKTVTISFDSDVCQHSGNCVKGLAAVFDTANKPWINPDGATRDDVVAQVALCPSGALRIEPSG